MTSDFIEADVQDEILAEIDERFLNTGRPRDQSLYFAAGQENAKELGLNWLRQEGLSKRAAGGNWGLIKKVAALAIEDKIEDWNSRKAALVSSIETKQLESQEC